MPFLSLHEAMGYALLGIDPAAPLAAGSATDLGGKKRGMISAAFDGTRSEPAKAKSTMIGSRTYVPTGGVRTMVSVYHGAPRGRRASETWPCVSYEMVGIEFSTSRYVYKADRFSSPVASSMTTVVIDGKELTGPALRKVRDNPEPYDVIFQIDTWAKHDHESAILNKVVLDTFPARGAIKAIQQDGTPYVWEMTLHATNKQGNEGQALEDQLEHGCHWSFIYGIETFLDNTLVTQLRRTITSYDVDVEAM